MSNSNQGPDQYIPSRGSFGPPSQTPEPPWTPLSRPIVVWIVVIVTIALVLGPILFRVAPQQIALWHVAAAQSLYQDDKLEKADEELHVAEKWDPDCLELALTKSKICVARKQYDDALAACDRAMKLAPHRIDLRFERQQILLHLERYDEALEDGQKQLKDTSRASFRVRTAILNQLAYTRGLANKTLEQGLKEIDEALATDKDEPAMLDTRGFLLYRMERYDEALADLDSSVDQMEGEFEKRKKLDVTSVDQRGLKLKLKEFSHSLAVIRYHRGLILEKLNEQKKADEDFARTGTGLSARPKFVLTPMQNAGNSLSSELYVEVDRFRFASEICFVTSFAFRVLLVGFLFFCPTVAHSADDDLESSLKSLKELVPHQVGELHTIRYSDLDTIATTIVRQAAERTWNMRRQPPEPTLTWVTELIGIKRQVDTHREQVLALRTGIVETADSANRQAAACAFLKATTRLSDLAGRLRFTLTDAIESAIDDLSGNPAGLDKLINLFLAERVEVSASLMTFALFDPEMSSELRAFPAEFKKKVLQLVGVTRSVEALPDLAQYLRDEKPEPELLLTGIEALRAVGLPQKPRLGQDPALPQTVITAAELLRALLDIPKGSFPAESQLRRNEILQWLTIRSHAGELDESYRYGESEVRGGDWVLFRNPSPYNQLTTLSPGLFTHVGVVAVEKGIDGVRRFVLVDLHERDRNVSAVNIDLYLPRTLHHTFLRHKDAAVGQRMNDAVLSLIGNPVQFDLQFRTDRVQAFKGKPLRGQKIHSYCLGPLLICAQETGRSRAEFFPLAETAAGEKLPQNLAQIGLALGTDFVSPSNALFSSQMNIIGHREPMYDPGREIREKIYDHFGASIVGKSLNLAPTILQLFRERIAEIAKSGSWYSRLFTRSKSVAEQAEIDSATRALTLIEVLDEITATNTAEFRRVFAAIMDSETDDKPNPLSTTDPRIAQQRRTDRQLHAALYQRYQDKKISSPELSIELVNYYATLGKSQVDERFFRDAK